MYQFTRQRIKKSNSMRAVALRRGLTLIELVVVLGVLAAVAAIMVPMFPNILRRAHKVTDTTQTSEVSKAVQMYQGMFVSYPDNFDLLTDGTAYPSYLPGGGTAPFGGFTTLGNLTSDEVAALQRVGINYGQPLNSTTTGTFFHPTMNPYLTTDPIADRIQLSTSTTVALLQANTTINGLNPAFLQQVRSADPTARFVVFGVGPRSSMIGQVIQDAPTSVPQDKDFTPDNTYSRVGVIFMVSGLEVSRTERARFIAAVALEDDELESSEKDLIGYYGVARGTQTTAPTGGS